jgi:nucleoid-associated protein YgaU
MSSYADVHQGYRRSRYYAPAVPPRRAARIKAGRVLVVFAVLSVVGVRAAYGGGRTGTEHFTVHSGQTVWSIAQARYPEDDTRARVADIVRLNHLGGAQDIYPGQDLLVPAQ